MSFSFTYGTLTHDEVLSFLQDTDADHIVPLSMRVDIDAYAKKLSDYSDFALVWSGKKMVGMISCYTNRPPVGYISNVCIKKEYQGKGLFSKLFHLLTEKVIEKGIDTLRLEVDHGNKKAFNVYSHIGFYRMERDRSKGKQLLEMKLKQTRTMTECERIIADGTLPESFFNEEVICDFKVDLHRKKIWAVSLDLLFKFDEICRKHGLKYTLAYGSLLGAIRHRGFIPWDDDIDVFMTREDYEHLMLLESEFKFPYYLQIPGKDNGYLFSFPKLRNSNTTALSYAFRYERFNQGVALDIFILDNYNPATLELDLESSRRLLAVCCALMRRGNPHPDEKDIDSMNRFPEIRDGEIVIRELEATLKKNQNNITDKYICLCNLFYDIHKGIFEKKHFDSVQSIDFYGHKVLIPAHYDTILKTIYGDYMALPPIEERGRWHAGALMDPDKPYTEYVNALWAKESHQQ